MKSILYMVGKASLCMRSAPETNDGPLRKKKKNNKQPRSLKTGKVKGEKRRVINSLNLKSKTMWNEVVCLQLGHAANRFELCEGSSRVNRMAWCSKNK